MDALIHVPFSYHCQERGDPTVPLQSTGAPGNCVSLHPRGPGNVYLGQITPSLWTEGVCHHRLELQSKPPSSLLTRPEGPPEGSPPESRSETSRPSQSHYSFPVSFVTLVCAPGLVRATPSSSRRPKTLRPLRQDRAGRRPSSTPVSPFTSL